MTRPPTIRVDEPQDVCQAYCRRLSGARNWMSKALAKFCPSSCEVPICSALPSPVISSMVIVLVAPANRSRAVLRPTTTGSASTSTTKSSYTSRRICRA